MTADLEIRQSQSDEQINGVETYLCKTLEHVYEENPQTEIFAIPTVTVQVR